MAKTLTTSEYYHALSLFMIASRKQREVDKLETEMNEILGDENGSHASDALYSHETLLNEKPMFDDALERMGIKVIEK